MAVLTVGEALDRVTSLGGSVTLSGDKVNLTLPGGSESEAVAQIIRDNRDAVAGLLRSRDSKAPTIAEVEASLPAGVRVVFYEPKTEPWPLMVRPASVVTDLGAFIRSYLRDLKARIENAESKIGPSATDCIEKLKDAGLELRIEGQQG